jgi:hypothetical protein
MTKSVIGELGHWRKPKSLDDAKQLTDTIIDNLDPEWLIKFGLDLLRVPEATEYVVSAWAKQRRPPLRQHLPYFIFMLSINIFFCLVLPTQLLRNVKPSHQIDLAYLYYLPFCSVFTSKDNFHVQVAPLFLSPHQTFVHGIDLKEDLRRQYSALPVEERQKGLMTFARCPPDDTGFVTTKLWDKYLPGWRAMLAKPNCDDVLQDQELVAEIKRLTFSEQLHPHDERDTDKLDYVTVQRKIRPRKGKWHRFSEEVERQHSDRIKSLDQEDHQRQDEPAGRNHSSVRFSPEQSDEEENEDKGAP